MSSAFSVFIAEEKIRKAAKRGRYIVYLDVAKPARERVKRELEEKGFKVKWRWYYHLFEVKWD